MDVLVNVAGALTFGLYNQYAAIKEGKRTAAIHLKEIDEQLKIQRIQLLARISQQSR
jgi:hypothetical protein